MLESNGTLHVAASVVDGFGDGQETVMDRAGARVVVRLTGVDQLQEELRGDVAVPDEEAVDLDCQHGLIAERC